MRAATFILCSLFLVLASACAARTPPRPVGTPTPDPTAAEAFVTATAACQGFRSIEGELSLSGRAGGERVRGRILTGLESGGAVRLEAVAPFGAPFFILAGRGERAARTRTRRRKHRPEWTHIGARIHDSTRVAPEAYARDPLQPLEIIGCRGQDHRASRGKASEP